MVSTTSVERPESMSWAPSEAEPTVSITPDESNSQEQRYREMRTGVASTTPHTLHPVKQSWMRQGESHRAMRCINDAKDRLES